MRSARINRDGRGQKDVAGNRSSCGGEGESAEAGPRGEPSGNVGRYASGSQLNERHESSDTLARASEEGLSARAAKDGTARISIKGITSQAAVQARSPATPSSPRAAGAA
jgi:hypothetical protein